MIQCSNCPNPGQCRDFGCIINAREVRDTEDDHIRTIVREELERVFMRVKQEDSL